MKHTKEEILKIVFDTIDEFHQSVCFSVHTRNLKQTILWRLDGIEVKVKQDALGQRKHKDDIEKE